MNLLKQICIQGQLQFGYACLTMEYTFINEGKEPLSPRYFFPVPQGGQVTGFQFLTAEHRLLRAKVCAVTKEHLLDSGLRLRQLADSLYCLEADGLAPGESCRVLIEMLVSLQTKGVCERLVVPLGGIPLAGVPMIRETCSVTLTLYTGQYHARVTSHNHPITMEEQSDGTVVTACVQTGEDFVLDIYEQPKVSMGLARERWDESIGVYRLYTKHPQNYEQPMPHKVALLLDTERVGDSKWLAGLKEITYRALQALPEGILVEVFCSCHPYAPLLQGRAGAELEQELLVALNQCTTGGPCAEMLEMAASSAAFQILITTGYLMQGEISRRKQLHLITFGHGAFSPLADGYDGTGYGAHSHIYPQEELASATADAVNRLLRQGDSVQVRAVDATATECLLLPYAQMATDGYVQVAVRSTGVMPRVFAIEQNGKEKELITVERGRGYPHLPMTEQLYAYAKLGQLSALMRRLGMDAIPTMKKQMEEISVKYGVISTETMLAIEQEGTEPSQAVPLELCLGGKEFFDRPTIFGETETAVTVGRERERLLQFCQDVLLEHVRSDGSICDSKLFAVQERANETAMAVVALQLHWGEETRMVPILDAANQYLKAHPPTGLAGVWYDKPESVKTNRHVMAAIRNPETLLAHVECRNTTAAAQLLLWLSM